MRTALALLTAAGEEELDDWFAVSRVLESAQHWEQIAWALAEVARRLAGMAGESSSQTADEVIRQIARSIAVEDWESDGARES